MNDKDCSKAPRKPNYGLIPKRFTPLDKKGSPKQPSADNNKEKAKQSSYDPVAVSVKWATWVIAIATGINVSVAALQWSVLSRTDETTRQALVSVQRPFVSMTNMNVRGLLAKDESAGPHEFCTEMHVTSGDPGVLNSGIIFAGTLCSKAFNCTVVGQFDCGNRNWPLELDAACPILESWQKSTQNARAI
jgi:hypothetical protein